MSHLSTRANGDDLVALCDIDLADRHFRPNACNESEQAGGFFIMIEDKLALPFVTQVMALSDAYDMNPVREAHDLKLNVSEADSTTDLDLARSVAPYFRVSSELAEELIERSQIVVKQWPKIAGSLHVPPREQERMAAAFRLAG